MENLNELAKNALNELKQQEENSKEVIEEKDIYAEFNNEQSDINTKGVHDIKLRTYQDYNDEEIENPSLRNQMTEEDLSEEERDKLLTYDEPLFVGGPTKTQVDSWKKQWDGYDIFVVEILTQYFVFRTLNRFEYKQLIALPNIDALQREEIIDETVTLWPIEYRWNKMAEGKAGIPSTLAKIIMEKSGFVGDYSIQVL